MGPRLLQEQQGFLYRYLLHLPFRACRLVLLRQHTPATIRDTTALRSALENVRRQGWAENVSEAESGVASIAAPVRNGRGDVVAAVSVAGPTQRLGSDSHSSARAIQPGLDVSYSQPVNKQFAFTLNLSELTRVYDMDYDSPTWDMVRGVQTQSTIQNVLQSTERRLASASVSGPTHSMSSSSHSSRSMDRSSCPRPRVTLPPHPSCSSAMPPPSTWTACRCSVPPRW